MNTGTQTRILGLLCAALASAASAGVLPSDAVVAGKTLGEWTAEHWKWVYSVPTNQNSFFDEDGSRVRFGQAGPVFFAPGGPPNVSGPPLTLSYAVPANKYLLVPIANAEWDNIDIAPPLTVQQLRDNNAAIIRGVSELHASLDGVSISFTQDVVSGFFNHRAISPVFSFNFTNADNINTLLYGHPVTGLIDPIVADGYWLMIEPLPVGIHELQTGATIGFPPFSRSLIHQITVVPDPTQYVVPPTATVCGKTQSEMSAEWWQHNFSLATNVAVPSEISGRVHLPAGRRSDCPIYYPAARIFSGTNDPIFTVPENGYLFFPIQSVWCDNVNVTPPMTVPELRDCAASLIDAITEVHASIDGASLGDILNRRQISPLFSFDFANPNNIYSQFLGEAFTALVDPIAADGYYLLLKPLPRGMHRMTVGASFGPPHDTSFDVPFYVNVVPDPLPFVAPTNVIVGGKTIGEWTADWWKWVFSIPTNQNPHLDTDGGRAQVGQPDGPVFFLGGHSGLSPDMIARSFTVPEGKFLLVPLLVAQNDNIDVLPPLPLPDVIALLADFVNDPRDLRASINRVAVPNLSQHRARSPAFSFDFTDPDNFKTFSVGHPITGLVDPIVSDGYWLMLRPLPAGSHELRFGGAFRLPFFFTNDVTANITVVPVPVPEQIGQLIASVEQSKLSARHKRLLVANLRRAGRWIERGHPRAGIRHLRVFQNNVRSTGRNNQFLRDELIPASQRIVDQVREELNQ